MKGTNVLIIIAVIVLIALVTWAVVNKVQSQEPPRTTVTLVWDQNIEPDVVGYTLYWGGSSGNYSSSVRIDHPDTMYTFDITSWPKGHYYMAVTAVDTFRNESGYSNEVIVDLKPPNNPNKFRCKN